MNAIIVFYLRKKRICRVKQKSAGRRGNLKESHNGFIGYILHAIG